MLSRIARVALWLLAVPVVLVLLAVGLLLTGWGQRLLGDAVAWGSGGMVRVERLALDLPGGIRAGQISVADETGVWLTVEQASVAWSPGALFSRVLLLRDVRAARVAVARLPAPGGGSAGGTTTLPGRVELQALHVDRLELAAALAGAPAVLAVDGAGRLDTLDTGQLGLTLARQDGAGRYRLEASSDGTRVTASLNLNEPEGGLVGGLAGLPALGALDVQATLDGALAALAVKASLAAGPLRATLAGTVDAVRRAAQLDVSGTAPAMAPRPGISWQSVRLDGHVEGDLAAPKGSASLHIQGFEAQGASIAAIDGEASAGDGQMRVQATLAGLRGPGVAVFADTPVRIAVAGPIGGTLDLSLLHPLVELRGTAATDGTGTMRLSLPDLAGLQGITGLPLAGTLASDASLRWQQGALTVAATGTLGLTAAPEPALPLLGPAAKFTLGGTVRGLDLNDGRVTLDGRAVTVQAGGSMKGGVAAAEWHVALTDLHVLAPGLGGTLRLDGTVSGPQDDLAAGVTASGDVAVGGAPATPVTARIDLRGLPAQPSGTITAGGTLDGAPLALAATLARETDGTLRFELGRGAWKTGTAASRLVWRPGAALPEGSIALGMTALADIGHVFGLALGGGMEATVQIDPAQAVLALTLRDAGLPGTVAHAATLEATVKDPMGAREVAAKLSVAGLAAGGMVTGFELAAAGPPDRLSLQLSGTTGTAGDPIRLNAAMVLDAIARRLDLSRLQAGWRGETLALAGPARVDLSDGVAVDRLRLALRDAGLELAGRLFPVLDLTVTLRDLPVALAALVAPEVKAEGRVQASARLTGPPAAPSGTVRLSGTGLRWRDGVGLALKPGSFTANATLAGGRARLEARAESGDTSLTVAGTAPLAEAGAIDLKLNGRSGLAVLDAVMAASGRRLRGAMVIDAAIGGTIAAPRASGTVRLANGELQDQALGVRIKNIDAVLAGEGETLRLVSLSAQAGGGTIAAQGTAGLAGSMPVQLQLTLRKARLLASSLVTGAMDADLSVTGSLTERLAATGTVTLGRTDIRVPEQLPPSVAVLNIRRPGDKPPPPPAPPLAVALDVTLKAPGQIFLRGRGIDAELQGDLHVGGEASAPRPSGAFTLRRGSFTLAGQVLNFTSGEIRLDGSLPIDPVLDFKASTSTTGTAGTIIATIAITGHASKPVVTLTSVPDLPADEVLAQLLFNRSTSTLGPLELAQLAGALAELSGVGPKVAPLEALRAKLGLDRLSLGAGTNGAAASVAAGRTIAPGVYLGAKQNAGAGGTQATVEIDLYKGLKLKADIGTGGGTGATGAAGSSNGTEVGVTYQFEY